MNITQKASPNRYNGRNGWKPDMIVCHITEGSYSGAVSWLCNPASEASAHFVVAQDGRITQLVPLTDSAWCNGTSTSAARNTYYGKSTLAAVRERKTNANYYAVSIEHEGVYAKTKGKLTDVQLKATTELIAYIRKEVKRIYGVEIPLDREHIVGHYQINPVTKPNCPGSLFQFDAIISALKGSNTTPSSSGSTGSTLYRVQVGAYGVKSNAEKILANLKAKGYDTMLVQVNNLYKVQVGAYSKKENADNMAAKLEKDSFDTYITTAGGTPVSSGSTPTTSKIKVGSKVKVKSGSKTYAGGKLANFVYSNIYDVQQIDGDRAVIGLKGKVTAAVKVADLIL